MELQFSQLPPSRQIINYLENHPQLVAEQKPLYTPEKIMMLLEYRNLDLLKEQFQAHGHKGINLKTFIWLMKHSIPYDIQQKYQLFYSLVRLFKEIDIDNNHYLQWDQFIAYIIEGVKQSHNKSYDAASNLSQKQILQNAYALKTKTFTQSQNSKDTTLDRASAIKLIVNYPQKNMLLCLEEEKNFIRFYNNDNLKQRVQERLYVSDNNHYIVSFTISEDYLVVLNSNKQIYFYEYIQNNMLQALKTTTLTQQTDIFYLKYHNLFLVTGKEYKIRSLNKPITKKNKFANQDICFSAHDNQITSIKQLFEPFCVVTSSMDGTIKLWDFKNKKNIIAVMKDPNFQQLIKRGIKGIDISYNNIIVSWGFQSYMNIWQPEKSLISPHIGLLKSNNGMIVNAICIKNSTMVVSIDNKNNVRVWQLKRSQCIQVLACETKVNDIVAMNDGFVVYGRRMIVFEKSKQLLKFENEKEMKVIPTHIFFNSFYSVIIITTNNQIRIYNAKNGILIGVYNIFFDDAHDSTYFSCFCKGKNSRKLYIGNSQGGIGLVNIKNGANIKNVRNSNKEDISITQMYFFSRQNILVVISDKIQNFDEQLFETQLVKTLTVNHNSEPQTLLQFSEDLLIFITVCINRFYVWSFQSSKLLYAEELYEEIIDVKFLKVYFGFIICTKNKLSIYKMNISLDNFQFVFNIVFNNIPTDKNALSTILIFSDDKIVEYQSLKIYNNQQNANQKIVFSNIQKEILKNYGKSKQTKQRVKILIGDMYGKLTVFDATPFVEYFQIPKLVTPKLIKYFLFKRLQTLNLQQTIEHIIKQRPKRVNQQCIINLNYFTTITQAHNSQINNIVYLEQISAIATCSSDQTVKIFTTAGQELCHLDLHKLKVNKWNLPMNWVQQKIKQFQQVINLLNELESQSLEQKHKDKLISRFLINLYFKPENKQQLKNRKRKFSQLSPLKKIHKQIRPTSELLSQQVRLQVAQSLQEEFQMKFRKTKVVSKEEKNELKQIRQPKVIKQNSAISKDFKFQLAEIFKTPLKNPNANQTDQTRPKSHTLYMKRTVSQNKIIKVTKKEFAKNIISIKQLKASTAYKPQNKQFVKDTIFKKGQGRKLLKSASKIAVSQFFANSQKNVNMQFALFKKMGKIFQDQNLLKRN